MKQITWNEYIQYISQQVQNDSGMVVGWFARDELRNGIFVPRVFIDLCAGFANDAIILSQMHYWSDRGESGYPRLSHWHNDHLWIVKQYEEWKKETGIPVRTCKESTARLEQLGFIIREAHLSPFHTAVNGKPERAVFYRLNWQKLFSAVIQWQQEQSAESALSYQSAESALSYESTKSALSYNTENTSNLTSHTAAAPESSRVESNTLASLGSHPLTSFVDTETSHTSATKNHSTADDDTESGDDTEEPTQAADYYNSDYEPENNNSHYKGVRAAPKPAPKQKKAKATFGRRQQDTSDEQDDSRKPRYTPPRPTVVPAVQKREKTPLKAESGFVAWVKEQWGGSTIKDEAKAVLEENTDLFEMEGFKEWAAAVIQESNDYTKTEYNKPRSSSLTIAGRVTDREAFEAWKVEKSAEVAKEKAQEYDDNIIELTPEELERLLEAKRKKKEAQGT